MKFQVVYKLFALMFLAFIFQSRSNGPGNAASLAVTGAPGSTGMANGQPGTCGNGGCHGSGTFNPNIAIQLIDGANAIEKYEPGKTYIARYTITVGDGTPAAYGFQAVTLDDADNNVGTWGTPGSGLQVVEIGGRSYVEHSSPNQASNSFEMEWTAPEANTGPVTIYAAGLASNLNGNTGGDGVANGMLTLPEDNSSSTSSAFRQYANLKIYPNPVQNLLNVEITSRTTGTFDLRFTDISGKEVKLISVGLSAGANERSFDVSELEKGMYIIQLCGETHLTSTEMIKL